MYQKRSGWGTKKKDHWNIDYFQVWTRSLNVNNPKDSAVCSWAVQPNNTGHLQTYCSKTWTREVLITNFFLFQVWNYPFILHIPFEEFSIIIIIKRTTHPILNYMFVFHCKSTQAQRIQMCRQLLQPGTNAFSQAKQTAPVPMSEDYMVTRGSHSGVEAATPCTSESHSPQPVTDYGCAFAFCWKINMLSALSVNK